MVENSLKDALKDLSGTLKQLSSAMRALSAICGGGTGSVFGMAGVVPGGQAFGLAMSALSLLDLLRKAGPELRFHQEIVINIGEGMISEKAFWDNLVSHYILPGLERNGFIPAKVRGKG
ncbi:MAG: hypothetical protein ABIM74_01900 [candidate division WOR-3 bacterium]